MSDQSKLSRTLVAAVAALLFSTVTVGATLLIETAAVAGSSSGANSKLRTLARGYLTGLTLTPMTLDGELAMPRWRYTRSETDATASGM